MPDFYFRLTSERNKTSKILSLSGILYKFIVFVMDVKPVKNLKNYRCTESAIALLTLLDKYLFPFFFCLTMIVV